MVRSKDIQPLIDKAKVLIEALPYIRAFKNKTIVIKYGGAAMADNDLKSSFARDITLLKLIGLNPVVVHGGGPQIGETLAKMNIETRFVNGVRYTDHETLNIVEMVLVGKVNKEIVSLINSHGGRAVGLSGKDGELVKAEKMLIEKKGPELERPEIIDMGMVGKITEVNTAILRHLDSGGFIPVIAPVGYGIDSTTYNINADVVAAAIAGALGAEKLVLLTDTAGVLDSSNQLISTLTKKDAQGLIDKDVIKGGMAVKAEACFTALEAGVKKAHIVDGRITHSALLEIFTDKGIGTEIRQD